MSHRTLRQSPVSTFAPYRCNPALRTFAERLRAAGKRPKVVITAVMRKLLLLAVAILRSGAPFSETHRRPEHVPAT